MRIIGGSLKGKYIQLNDKLPVRPTTDFAKEALFNILENRIDFTNKTVLDLFSGTGNISYEFCSRGAKKVYSIDESYHCYQFIKKNIRLWNIENIFPIKNKAIKYIEQNQLEFDIIFADPPFDYHEYSILIEKILNSTILCSDGLFILEHSSKNDFSSHNHCVDSRKYGAIKFSFFSKNKL